MTRSGRTSVQVAVSLTVVAALAAAIYYAPQFAGKVAYAVTAGQNQAEREKLGQMAKADTLSPLFNQVAKVVMPSVVEVRVVRRVSQPQVQIPEELRRFFEDQQSPFGRNPRQTPPQMRRPQQRELRGLGSGVIIDAQNGYIITNNHVVGGADQVEVITSDNQHLEAEWVKTDPATDLAVVKVKPDSMVAAPLGDSDAAQVGDMVMAIGSPEGLPQTVTTGIISAKGRNHTGLGSGGSLNLYQNFLQTDAAINHGNSGGPLVNMRGEVIGINTAIVSRTGVNEGIGLAIPSNMIKQIMDQLISKGKVTRGYLGVRLQEMDTDLAKSYGLAANEGALVTDLAPNGPAEKAGLKSGDVIVAVNGKKVASVDQLRMTIANVTPGGKINLDIIREGKKRSLEMTVGEQPQNMTAAFTGAPSTEPNTGNAEKYGIKVTALTPEMAQQLGYKTPIKGVVVTEVEPASNAASKGLQQGMLITKVNDKPVTTPGEFVAALSAKEAVEGVRLQVTSPQGNQFVFVTPTKSKKLTTTPAPPEQEEEEE